MKLKTIFKSFLIAGIAVGMISCSEANKPKKVETQEAQVMTENHKVEILDILQTNNYSYLLVKEKFEEFWMAIDQRNDIEKGEEIYYAEAMLMKNFHSKELDRTFDEIYFVSKTSKTPIDKQAEWFKSNHNTQSTGGRKMDIDIEAIDGISIADLYANKEEYVGKNVKLKGVVVRFNEKIMNTNWVHLQDGTGSRDDFNFDITITTSEYVQVQDTVAFEGTVVIDKDFGAGYFYPLILENATIIK